MPVRLIKVLEGIGRPRVLVAGDLILDRYVAGTVERVSPEAPIQVFDVVSEAHQPGGAGCVAQDLAHLKAEVVCCGIVGKDAEGKALVKDLQLAGVEEVAAFVDAERPTTRKTRYLGHVQSASRAGQQILRVDHESRRAISADDQRRVLAFVEKRVRNVDAVVLSDYNKGFLLPPVLKGIIGMAARRKVPVLLDPNRDRDFSLYRGVTAMTPNRFETHTATGIKVDSPASAAAAARKLVRALGMQYAVITLDKDGILLYGRDGTEVVIPTEPKAVTDVTGAGDMVISVLALVVAGGGTFEDAARLANVAAGIEVTKIGAVPVSRKEIVNELMIKHQAQPEKVLPVSELARVLKTHRRRREKIVFTNGCFDILHSGHAQYLDFARAQGDLLVVGLNSDASVRAIKGERRPFVPQQDRARLLAALESVDYVVLFDEPTPLRLIRQVRPDVLVKGEDWRDKGVVGREYVESYGGSVVLAPVLRGRSTTGIVETILERFRRGETKG